ncbi:hypothetical protein OAI07_00760 [Akkermansiaceae bacterium]|nr:hypothetical protein [Akkermansiaceae bacterium]
MNIENAIEELEQFSTSKLTKRISDIEGDLHNCSSAEIKSHLGQINASSLALTAAETVKRLSAQIDVKIHALGILRCLPHILEDDEVVQSVSLGAGNTGRHFDLETNLRIAEFKFIGWRGGSEAIRQNGIFKDFYQLAEHTSNKEKFLYLLNIDIPLKFFNGGRSIASVLGSQSSLLDELKSKYPKVEVVRDYFRLKVDEVKLANVSDWLPELQAPKQ